MQTKSVFLTCLLLLPLPAYAADFSGVVSSGTDAVGYDPSDPTSPQPIDLTGESFGITFSVDPTAGFATSDGRGTTPGSFPVYSAGLSEPDFTNVGYYANDLYYDKSHHLIGFYTEFIWSGDDSSAVVTISNKNSLNGWDITVNPDGTFSGELAPGSTGPSLFVNEFHNQFFADVSITSFSVDVVPLVHGSPTPEPSDWAYLLLGFAALGCAVRGVRSVVFLEDALPGGFLAAS
jgi:hypothetical protein